MTQSKIIRQRLYNQRLLTNQFHSPVAVVRWMGAVQGQEYPFAKRALGMRTAGTNDGVVEKAFNDGEILRTHVMRPTWHFVAREDICWMLELTAPRVLAAIAYGSRQVSLERTLAKRTNAVIERALRGGNALTRKELRQALESAGIQVDTAQRMGVIMMWAELDGIVCSGPRIENQFTYMLLQERATDAHSLAREQALAELTRRYFTGHGPATVNDFAWWSGLTASDCKAGLAMLASQLSSEQIDGKTYWFSPDTPVIKTPTATAHLLPVLDEYVVAYRDASVIFDAGLDQQAKNRNFVSSIALNGRIVGEWKPVAQGERIVVHLAFYSGLTATGQRAVENAVQQYSEFLGQKKVQIQNFISNA